METSHPDLSHQEWVALAMAGEFSNDTSANTVQAPIERETVAEPESPAIDEIEAARQTNLTRTRQIERSIDSLYGRGDDVRWMGRAACKEADPNLFHPYAESKRMTKEQIRAAKQFCAKCPVLNECGSYALRHHESGVWGSTTEQERKWLKSWRWVQTEVTQESVAQTDKVV